MGSPIGKADMIARGIFHLFGAHVVISCNKFFGKEGYLVKMYIVKDSFYDGHTWVDEELFRSTSPTYTCLFCRDLLYTLQDRPLPPPDNEGYEKVLEKNRASEKFQMMKRIYGNNNLLKESPTTT
jgi:hypothetical protein